MPDVRLSHDLTEEQKQQMQQMIKDNANAHLQLQRVNFFLTKTVFQFC